MTDRNVQNVGDEIEEDDELSDEDESTGKKNDEDDIEEDEEDDDEKNDVTDDDKEGNDDDEEEDDDDDEEEDEDNEEEEEEEDEDEDEEDEDYDDLFMGLSKGNVERVRQARSDYLKQREQSVNVKIQQQVAREVEDEWKGILSLPELTDTTFDFQVLRNILSQDQNANHPQSSSSLHDGEVKLQKSNPGNLVANTRDPWSYDIDDPDESDGDDQDEDDDELEESDDDHDDNEYDL